MPLPILPSNIEDPTGQDRRERGAIADFSRRLSQVRRLYVQAVAALPSRQVTVNATTTEYLLTPELLAVTLAGVADQVDRILLEGGTSDLWFTSAYVQPAYQQGTAQQMTNLSVQSQAYAASRSSLATLLSSQAYQTRLGFLRSRVFDSLKGFSQGVASRMSQVLQDGLAVGKNALAIARDITAQTGIEKRRAELIARTEVPGALRQARLAEADQATADLGLKSKEMHLSALSPTTRPSHRARHAHLYTTQEQREWWSQDGNRYNCKCSTVTVLLNDKGDPLTPGIIAKARAMLDKNPVPSQA